MGILNEKVSALDFERLKHKFTDTDEAEMAVEEWDAGQLEYQRFLTLKMLYPSEVLVPSKLVDKVWHAHILDTRAYREDCEKLFGRFIDHYPYFGVYGKDDQKLLEQSFDKTIDLYEKHFDVSMAKSWEKASRCEGHACHAPSACACRVPGACK
ncbi:hypothetical protein CXF72_13320 [Psychromonas sp. MB-3u-54]|nr:hypothetical protein CXF72_13320 [Psychromonas sp. MB-3u-54]